MNQFIEADLPGSRLEGVFHPAYEAGKNCGVNAVFNKAPLTAPRIAQ